MEWSSVVPREVGLFWFYGWVSGFSKRNGRPKELSLIKIRTNVNGSWFYISDGSFIYPGAEGDNAVTGVWQKAVLPQLPDEDISVQS